MAIPPGSVFKLVTALALLDSPGFDPTKEFDCQGFLAQPDRERCQIFRRYGVGHGPVSLNDALAQSCNVYFFHHATQLAPEQLTDWALRLGFGRQTGIELPGEASGSVPGNGAGAPGPDSDATDTRALSIGQSTLTVTPLQVARFMATIANGGHLLAPHIVARDDAALGSYAQSGAPVPGLEEQKLSILREAMVRVVRDPAGTAYAVLDGDGRKDRDGRSWKWRA